AIAILAIAAAAPVDVRDGVVGDNGVVGAGGAAPDADAGIAAPIDAIAGDQQAATVHRVNGGIAGGVEAAFADGGGGVLKGERNGGGGAENAALEGYGVAGADREQRRGGGVGGQNEI